METPPKKRRLEIATPPKEQAVLFFNYTQTVELACEKSASKQFALAVLTYRDKTQSQHGLFHHHSIVENSWQSESHRTRSDCQC